METLSVVRIVATRLERTGSRSLEAPFPSKSSVRPLGDRSFDFGWIGESLLYTRPSRTVLDFCSFRTGSANCGGRRRTPRGCSSFLFVRCFLLFVRFRTLDDRPVRLLYRLLFRLLFRFLSPGLFFFLVKFGSRSPSSRLVVTSINPGSRHKVSFQHRSEAKSGPSSERTTRIRNAIRIDSRHVDRFREERISFRCMCFVVIVRL